MERIGKLIIGSLLALYIITNIKEVINNDFFNSFAQDNLTSDISTNTQISSNTSKEACMTFVGVNGQIYDTFINYSLSSNDDIPYPDTYHVKNRGYTFFGFAGDDVMNSDKDINIIQAVYFDIYQLDSNTPLEIYTNYIHDYSFKYYEVPNGSEDSWPDEDPSDSDYLEGLPEITNEYRLFYIKPVISNPINWDYNEYINVITTESVPDYTESEIYRVYNYRSGEHLLCTSLGEYNKLIKLGWKGENISFTAYTDIQIDAYLSSPVYRLYNPNVKGGDHHYTAKTNEISKLLNKGWKMDKDSMPLFYSKGDVPVYRLYNSKNGRHHYTPKLGEKDKLVKKGWKYEGIAWYAISRS